MHLLARHTADVSRAGGCVNRQGQQGIDVSRPA
jgi:hypothetical protein